jgi:hypothetical protein
MNRESLRELSAAHETDGNTGLKVCFYQQFLPDYNQLNILGLRVLTHLQ